MTTLDSIRVIDPFARPAWSREVTFDWSKQKRTGLHGTVTGRCIGADSFDVLIDGTTEVAGDIPAADIRPRAALRAVKGKANG